MRVFTYGVFDLIHVGHAQSLQKAKALGDHLTVGVFSDAVAESFKRKPIIPQDQRLKMVIQLEWVDEAFILESLVPDVSSYDVVAKGRGAGFEDMEFNIEKVLLPYHPEVSTTKIIEKIQNAGN